MRAIQVKHLCTAKVTVNNSHSFSLALFSWFQLLHVVFILQLVNYESFRVASAIAICECTACASASTRERLASAVKFLVSGTVTCM